MSRTGIVSLRVRIALLAVVAQAACVPLPIPHKDTLNPAFRGRVVDARTGEPLAGISVSLRVPSAGTGVATDQSGEFLIPQTESWRWFWLLPLVPWDPSCPRNFVDLAGGSRGGAAYQPKAVEVQFCPPTVLLGDTGALNRVTKDLGTLRLEPASSPAESPP